MPWELSILIDLAPLLILIFFVNTYNLLTLWYLAGLYLILLGLFLLTDDLDILVGFLWVIDLGVGLVFFIFILHFSTFSHQKPTLDKSARVFVLSTFLITSLFVLVFIFLEPASNQHLGCIKGTWFFYLSWFDFYDFYYAYTVTDLNLLREVYFYQNSLEFFFINFVLFYGIVCSVLLCFLLKRFFSYLTSQQFKDFGLHKKAHSALFIRNQDFLKQQSTSAGSRVWSKRKNNTWYKKKHD